MTFAGIYFTARRKRGIGTALIGLHLLLFISCDPQGALYPGDAIEQVGHDALAVNWVPDGGFENGLDSWVASTNYGYVASGFQVNSDSQYVRTGERSVYINDESAYRADMSLPANDLPMTITLWVKGPGGGSGTLTVSISTPTDYDGDDELSISATADHAEWTEYTFNVGQVSGGASSITRLWIKSSGSVGLYVDDVEARIKDE